MLEIKKFATCLSILVNSDLGDSLLLFNVSADGSYEYFLTLDQVFS